jgi:sensor histidine kinase YesM
MQICSMKQKIPNIYNVIPILKNRALLHFSFWSVVVIVMVAVPSVPMPWKTFAQLFVSDLSLMLIFNYIVILVLIPQFLYTTKYFIFISLGLVLCLLESWLGYTITMAYFMDLIKLYNDPSLLSWLDTMPLNVLFFFLVTALKLVKDLMLQQYESEQEQKQKMVQELSFLRSQLSPHFLLNTMNNLYGLSVIKSDELPRLLLRFSDLLRYSIYDTKSEYVTVRSEMKYLSDFIELQKMRLSDKVNLNIQIPEVICNSGIVPMVLVVFVENAFKHSQDFQDSSKRFINIKIWIEGDFLHFISENNCGEPSSLNNDLSMALDTFKIKNEGIGIDTTLRRLELLYGKESLPIIEKKDGIYSVALKLKVVEINE